MSTIKKGDLVEFTDEWIQNYDDEAQKKHARFGVAVEDQREDRSVTVEVAGGATLRVVHIHAYAWAGWFPPELEDIWEKYNPEDENDWDLDASEPRA